MPTSPPKYSDSDKDHIGSSLTVEIFSKNLIFPNHGKDEKSTSVPINKSRSPSLSISTNSG